MKKNWLRMLSVLMCFLLCFGLMTGCGNSGGEEEGDGEVKDTVVIATPTDLKALDPMGNWSGADYYIYWTCYDRLLGYDYETGEFLPELATEWSVSEDGMEYTFKLRDDVYWHDGTQFTAKDVVYTVKRGIETQCGNYPSVSHAEAIDDFTVKYVMLEPNSLVMDKQWIGDAAIIQDGCGDNVATNIMGTGAYKVKEWIIGDHLTIEANPDYWGGEPEIKEIKFVTMPESNARLMAVQAGDVDAASIDAANVKAASADANLTVYSNQSTSLHYLGFNHNNEILSNKLVRQAISHAINKEDIIAAQLEGYGAAADTLVPSSIGGHNSDITGYEYDVEKAKDLLAEAGYPDGFDITLTLRTGLHDLAAQIIQANLKEIGINVTINAMEASAFSEATNANQSELFIAYRGSSNADYYLGIMHSDRLTDGRNLLGINDPAIDEALDKAKVTDGDARNDEYKACQQIAHDEAVLVPLYSNTVFAVSNKALTGVQVLPTSGIEFTGLAWE
ncbi:MAG: ABC transporter substrate-binding protein [Firmicutes bacterium]|nr:ABC transporter substrate-binding protein [Bacillota bacterium]